MNVKKSLFSVPASLLGRPLLRRVSSVSQHTNIILEFSGHSCLACASPSSMGIYAVGSASPSFMKVGLCFNSDSAALLFNGANHKART